MSISISAIQVANAIKRAETRCEDVIDPLFGKESRLVYMLAIAITMGSVTTELIGDEGATSLAEETAGLMGVNTDNITESTIPELLEELQKRHQEGDF